MTTKTLPKTCHGLIDERLRGWRDAARGEVLVGYMARHCTAWERGHAFEKSVRGAVLALADYADSYAAQFDGDGVGTDGVLGVCWLETAKAVVGLLDGPTGRLDCGAVDGLVRDMARVAGFEECEADSLELKSS